MARVKRAVTTRRRRKRTLKLAKGYWGAKSKSFKMANQAVMKSLKYAYIGRRLRKRFSSSVDYQNLRRCKDVWNELFNIHARSETLGSRCKP